MIHVLIGNEPYLIARKKEEFISQISEPEMNLNVFSTFDEVVVETAEMCPIFDEIRVCLIEVDSLSALDNKAFKSYVSAPCQTTELVIIPREYDARTKVYKFLKEKNLLCVLDKLSAEDELIRFIGSELTRAKASMKKEALVEFLKRENYLENDEINLYNISNDLQTLVSVTNQITLDTVRDYVKSNESENVFALSKLLLNKDAMGLRKEAKKLNKEDAFRSISLLLREFRVALKAKVFSPKDIGVKYVTLNDMSTESLMKGVDICNSMIADIKTGNLDAGVALQLTLGKLLNL